MQRFWLFLIDPRTLAAIGFVTLAAFLFLGAHELRVAALWAGVLLSLAVLTACGVWAWRRLRNRRAAERFDAALGSAADQAVRDQRGSPQQQADVKLLRDRMRAAIKTLKASKLGHASGTRALYALPWYMVIGNPAAGKSTAIVRSGLQFPFAANDGQASIEGSVLQGIGGTRNCDWFFTTEGILLDTAGRYAVHEEDRAEWAGFLQLLKQHRPKAPVNGIIVAVSIAELTGTQPEFGIALAKQLRQRMQEITEQLGVFAPVYVVFTKADLIGGFAEFFMDHDRESRERVWGATLPYKLQSPSDATPARQADAIALFEQRFDELHQGLKESAIAHMGLHRGEQLPPGVLMFPLEFAALKPTLRNFLTTLFEDNPYQFRPVFRGFYFTSAVQQGESTNRANERVAQRFGLGLRAGDGAAVYSNTGFFLRDLFSKVIFADRQLVQQYLSPTKRRLRVASFLAGVLLLGTLLSLWTWSSIGNRQLVAHVQADLDQAVKLQDGKLDLASRMQALLVLQDRLAQLQSYRDSHPWSIGLGLYQGDRIEAVVKREYAAGLQAVMLQPVAEALEGYLTDVNAHAAQLRPMPAAQPINTMSGDEAPVNAANTPYTVAQASDVSDAYNALKAYLMLADRSHLEAGHMGDQLTRFWRGWLEANRGAMPREEMIRAAEKLISFSLTQMNDPGFPIVANNLTLVDQTRENLRRVVKGMPARERVFAEIKARAATRFGPVTVARIVGEADGNVVAGSTAVSGVYTHAAWSGYVKDAIQTAANKALQSEDWVLKSTLRDDLTLEGSPEHVQKALTEQYKTEYVAEWRRFMQGISVQAFGGFEPAVAHMNRLGDPTDSPIGKLMQRLYDETSWDNPSLLNERIGQTKRGFVEWFKQTVLGQAPGGITVNVDAGAHASEGSEGEGGKEAIPMGPIGREFAGVARLMMSREKDPTLMQRYLESLSKIRSRFNQMKNQGDTGPASRALMQATLDGGAGNGASELSDALKLVDEQMLTGMSDSAKAALRPLLVRPLMQSFAVLVGPTEAELNRVWTAQVLQSFNDTLAGKYPFDGASRIEAAPGEIAKVFGAQGSIAKFSDQALAGLTVRRGDTLTPRTWADIGIHLRPAFAGNFGGWVAPLPGQGDAIGSTGSNTGLYGGAGGAGGTAAQTDNQTVFQILPQAAPGLTEYTIEIDGQQLRYRNMAAAWTNFVWPSAQGAPGVKISGVTFDGRAVEFINFPGNFGLEKMLGSATRKKLDAALFELKWSSPSGANLVVPVKLRIISNPGATSAAGGHASGLNLKGLQLPALVAGDEADASDAR